MDKGLALASSDDVHQGHPSGVTASAIGVGAGSSSSSSFASWRAYGRALAQTPRRLSRRAFAATAPREEMSRVRARSGADMARALRWWDLVGLGLGGMVGAGVFVTTGRAARLYAGPGVVVSYAIAGLCALLSAFCYTEFAVDLPVAGGAFSYLRVTFGSQPPFPPSVNHPAFAVQIRMVLRPPGDGGVPDGCEPDHGVRLLQRRRGAQLHGLPRHGGRRGRAQPVADHRARPARGVQPGGPRRRRRHPPHLRLHLLQIDPEAPFSGAFKGRERSAWVSNVIGAGASLGILTSLMVAMLGQARYLCVIGRSGVMPAWLARVNPRTATPVNASAFLGVFTAALALFTELDILLNLVCIGTLFVFYMVANAVVYRRYVGSVSELARGGSGGARWPTLVFLLVFSLAALAFTLAWKLVPPEPRGVRAGLLAACAALAVAVVAAFQALVPQARVPELWGVPGMPWVPAASVFLNVFLLGSLDRPSYVRFAIFSAAALLVYVLYSVHASYDAEESGRLDVDGGKVQDEACTVV
ncbi:cationic amino acid transporter 6, chloroplastic-like isoform X2 [Miscanthus floridulus]|uniref:cationic amino acid transporter 6, chloroplastic-like isoform X2 n=1 Tax=Miscanthus floridulus TaxID=154761 RepID=UPI00345AC7E3